ncbi:MAG: SH3 domain-containing protein, partial [Clostridia bacterium]|nr:SH3 domain-containing protein [Clostridia bacterium]
MAKMLGCLKKTAALVMTIALIMMELVLPMAALASDLTTLPILTISYTDAYGATGMVNAMPAENQDGVLYWAQIVDPVTYPLQISAWVEGDASYYDLFMNGTTLDGVTFEVIQDTYSPDIISAVANLTAYADLEHTAWLATYPVYLSTQMLPTEEPEQPPVDVPVEPEQPPVDEPVVPPVDEPVTPADPYAPENFGVYSPLGGIEGYITTENRGPLNVRKTPNKDHKPIGTIPHEGSIIIHGVLDSGWYYVEYNGMVGYIYQDYVHQGSLAPVVPEQPPVDVPVEPEQPPVDEPIVPPVDEPIVPPVDEPVTPADPYAPENFGAYTPLGDIEGYITTANKGPLNMRKTPNKDYKAIGTIPHEGSIIIHGVLDSGWYYIQYNGLNGYVSGEFVNQGSQTPAPTSADVTFYYADLNGTPIRDAAVKTYENGAYADFSDMIPAIDGYTFQYASTDSLYIENGVANPSSITVTYAAVPTAADVTFYYVDLNGATVADSAVKNYANGSYTDFSDMIPAIDGYTFQYASTDSLYIENGVANPSSIT